MRVVMTHYIFAEPEPGYYSHTSISWAMQGPNQQTILLHRLGVGFQSSSREAEALREAGYRNPVAGDLCGFNLAFGYSGTYWDYNQHVDKERGENFEQAMRAVAVNSLCETPNLYPWETLAADGGVIVELGGGMGQASEKILEAFPDAGLCCVVQDKHLMTSEGMHNGRALSLQRHDFFDPQPIRGTSMIGKKKRESCFCWCNLVPGFHKIDSSFFFFFPPGAAAYLLRHTLYHWADDSCVEILRQIAPVMATHSRILICDQVLQDHSPSLASALYDIDMMTLFNGKARRLSEFRQIFQQADSRFYVHDVKPSQESSTTVIDLRISPDAAA